MFPRINAVFCDEQTPRQRKLRGELDAAAQRYQQARHNYQAALELQTKPWFGESATANEELRRALLDLTGARVNYGAVLRAIADSYALPEDMNFSRA
jgi:hypothetical protein